MAHAGTAHKYSKRLIAFEHSSPHDSSTTDAPNTLLWVGGLTDGLLTVPYPSEIAKSLPANWDIAEVLISSSYKGWGIGSLTRDARELGECVAYFKKLRPGKKVVIMGHSTGCQDIMEYVVGKDKDKREALDGIILQGGVSDREAWEDYGKEGDMKEHLEEAIRKSKELVDAGKGKEIMSTEGNTILVEIGGPLSAYRAYSLLVKGGDDDYFSSDLSDEHFATTFGKIPASTPVCFLLGSEDPYVPASVDRAALLKRWTDIIRAGGGIVDDEDGGVIPGAHHNLDEDPDEVVQDLVKRVCGFVTGLESNRTKSSKARVRYQAKTLSEESFWKSAEDETIHRQNKFLVLSQYDNRLTYPRGPRIKAKKTRQTRSAVTHTPNITTSLRIDELDEGGLARGDSDVEYDDDEYESYEREMKVDAEGGNIHFKLRPRGFWSIYYSYNLHGAGGYGEA